jgi:hypothetical protein
MIHDFDDFCLYMFVVVDDICQENEPLLRRPGPEPKCSDSELITMALVGECRGWDMETDMLCHWQEHRDLFPHIPSQSRFNRRRRNLMEIINLIRRIVLKQLDLAQERLCVIDSLPVPAVKFHLVPSSTGDWKAHGAKFGKVSSKNETIFGYKLHLLTTISGLILDFELAPANATDLNVGYELLQNHTGLKIFGDKGYISADKQRLLWEQRKSRLYTLKRSNQKKQISAQASRLINSVRQIIETVNSQLAGQFNIETNHAHTFWGLCSRLVTKLTAHTLSIYINRLLGNHDFLQIKALAFPN